MVPLSWYLIFAAALFSIGLFVVLSRRNAVAILLGIELMLNAVNLTLLAFAKYMPSKLPVGNMATAEASMSGHVMVIFVMAVAAAEVAVGLGIIMAIFRLRQNIDIDEMNLLRG